MSLKMSLKIQTVMFLSVEIILRINIVIPIVARII